jgi:putative addiction module component (TIGR02574 family)
MKLTEIPEVADLSTHEKIVLLEELWDSIRDDHGQIPVPDSHKAELNKRFDRHMSFPGEILTLEELRRGIEQRK